MSSISLLHAQGILCISRDDLCQLQYKFGRSHNVRIDMAHVPRQKGVQLLDANSCASWINSLFPKGLPVLNGMIATAHDLLIVDAAKFESTLRSNIKVVQEVQHQIAA